MYSLTYLQFMEPFEAALISRKVRIDQGNGNDVHDRRLNVLEDGGGVGRHVKDGRR